MISIYKTFFAPPKKKKNLSFSLALAIPFSPPLEKHWGKKKTKMGCKVSNRNTQNSLWFTKLVFFWGTNRIDPQNMGVLKTEYIDVLIERKGGGG